MVYLAYVLLGIIIGGVAVASVSKKPILKIERIETIIQPEKKIEVIRYVEKIPDVKTETSEEAENAAKELTKEYINFSEGINEYLDDELGDVD